MQLTIGPLASLPDRRCVAVDDGRAVVVRVGGDVHAFRNECLHQASRLDGGWVRDGVLTCPLHFWRYDVDGGACRNVAGRLEPYPVSIVDGEVLVDLPERTTAPSLREQLLARARTYERDRAWRERNQGA